MTITVRFLGGYSKEYSYSIPEGMEIKKGDLLLVRVFNYSKIALAVAASNPIADSLMAFKPYAMVLKNLGDEFSEIIK